MQHRAAVSQSPAFASRTLLTDKAVFDLKQIVGERFFVENMPVLLVKLGISVVPDLHQSVFYPKGVGEIIVQVMGSDFYRPILDVFSVEKLNPLGFGRSIRAHSGDAGYDQQQQSYDREVSFWFIHFVGVLSV
jgi:hypothetical protein